jgi:hypothetical protein
MTYIMIALLVILAIAARRRAERHYTCTPNLIASGEGEGVLRRQDLAAVSGIPDAGSAVQRRAEVVVAAQFRFTGGDAHAHRQYERALRVDRGVDRRPRRAERGAHAVAGVLEHPAAARLDGGAQHVVVRGQCHPHGVRLVLLPPRRSLDVGEQERDGASGCSRHQPPSRHPTS